MRETSELVELGRGGRRRTDLAGRKFVGVDVGDET